MIPDDQIDEMIVNGRPLKEIATRFPNKVEACEYYALRMSQTFAEPEKTCANCRRECDAPPLTFVWQANLHNAKTVITTFLLNMVTLLVGSLHSRWIEVGFETSHRICPACHRRQQFRGLLLGLLHYVLFAITIVAAIFSPFCLIFLVVGIVMAPEIILKMTAAVMGCLGLVGLVVWGFEKRRTLLIPPPLRVIGRSPFFLAEVKRQ